MIHECAYSWITISDNTHTVALPPDYAVRPGREVAPGPSRVMRFWPTTLLKEAGCCPITAVPSSSVSVVASSLYLTHPHHSVAHRRLERVSRGA